MANHVIYEFGPYELDAFSYKLLRDGQEVGLRARCFDLLLEFVKSDGQALTTDELIDRVWRGDLGASENRLAVTLNHLRGVLGEGYIETLGKKRYRFAVTTRLVPSTKVPPSPPGGALPLDSPVYVARSADLDFYSALTRGDSVVLLKGPRQSGKTSLLARGLQHVRDQGAEVFSVDFQEFTSDTFSSADKLLLTLCELLAERLDLTTPPHQTWSTFLSAGINFERYLRREAMANLDAPLVWALDEVDRVFQHPYYNDIFGLFRWFHNQRALDPDGPWKGLTLALAYATEAHLLITDPNQSPFNVGTRLTLEDFSRAEVEELNRRYGSPLDQAGLAAYFDWTDGHPYLAQCGLYEMIAHHMDLAAIQAQADRELGLFGDHLRAIWERHLKHNEQLCEALRKVLRGEPGLSPSDFYRLRSAGILAGDTPAEARPRCKLYADYLKKRLL